MIIALDSPVGVVAVEADSPERARTVLAAELGVDVETITVVGRVDDGSLEHEHEHPVTEAAVTVVAVVLFVLIDVFWAGVRRVVSLSWERRVSRWEDGPHRFR
jgi:hypothetical protein